MPHSVKIKVYYEDTDAGGVVYYARYLGYLERARTEFLLTHGVNVTDLHNLGYFFTVTHADIRYKKPARLGDMIEVITELDEIRHASFIVKHQILRDGILLIEASITIAYIDKNGKPYRLPDAFKDSASLK